MGNWKWSFGRHGKSRKRPSRESNPGTQQTRLGGSMVEHQPHLLGSRIRFPDGAFAIFSVSAKASLPISLSLSSFSFPFLFLSLSLSLQPFICAKIWKIVWKSTLPCNSPVKFLCKCPLVDITRRNLQEKNQKEKVPEVAKFQKEVLPF